jgi:hypothetical protein
MTENWKFRKAILYAFYNISQRNFGILLICDALSSCAWWHFCLDQNLVYNANGPLENNNNNNNNEDFTNRTFIDVYNCKFHFFR